MKTFGSVDILDFNTSGLLVTRVHKHEHDKFREFITKYQRSTKDDTTLDVEITGEAKLIETKAGGELTLRFTEAPRLLLEKKYGYRTAAQHATLRGVERFLFIAANNYEPNADDLYYIHEAILEQFGENEINPITEKEERIRTTSPKMTTFRMAKLIDGALNLLGSTEIPSEVLASIGEGMANLWKAWYKWRYTNKDGDPLYSVEQDMSWEEYSEMHTVCELCGLPGHDLNPLERMHMVSKGADETVYEFPWNWLRAHHNHHVIQHEKGWGSTLHLFPVIKGKYDRAIEKHNEMEA